MENKDKEALFEGKYMIAGVKARMLLKEGGKTKMQAEGYSCDFSEDEELFISIPEEFLQEQHKKYPHLSVDECEYMWTGELFYNGVIELGGFMLHASAVVYEGKGYLFSAPSGTGKSTHTQLWLKAFGEENAYILNDDKPLIRIEDGGVMVYGTPWSGKTDFNKNTGVPVQGICFLSRSEENRIKRLDKKSAVFHVLNQTIRPNKEESMEILLGHIDALISKTAVYEMGCNMSPDAAFTSYNEMSKDEKI